MAYCFKSGKIIYPTHSEARGAASRLRQRRRPVEIYLCTWCHNYHLASFRK